jgi:phosphoribosylformimino-5-aminoimidazole carboxamide ribotide isomerase
LEENWLKIIPVLDILGGVAVHAVRGVRRDYKPLKSVLCETTDPVEVAMAFKKLGFSELYVADLDAILTNRPNLSIIKETAERTGLRLMVDAGVANLDRAEELLRTGVSAIVIGTETLSATSFVQEAICSFGKERVVVSLDTKNGELLAGFDRGSPDPLDLLRGFQRVGLGQVILLDLARVGSNQGVNMPLLRKVLEEFRAKVFVGGGVRDVADIVELQKMGVFGVLLATALHSGKINVEAAKRAGLSLS